jgi:hypothetical protein
MAPFLSNRAGPRHPHDLWYLTIAFMGNYSIVQSTLQMYCEVHELQKGD